MKSQLRAESQGATPKNPLVPSWAEGLKAAELDIVRSRLRIRQKNESETRAPWIPLPAPGPWLQGVDVVGCFAPRLDWEEPSDMPEVDHKYLRAYASIAAGKISYHATAQQDLVRNAKWGVQEALSQGQEPIFPSVIFVPCLLADQQGMRIGRGGGFFDSYLKEHPEVLAIGVVHSDYVLRELPAKWLHAGDQRLSMLITESYILDFRQNSQKDGEAQL